MNLSPRLKRIADLVLPDVRMADIGTDHGYLPAYLLKSGKITKAIVTDIHPRPLEKAVKLLGSIGLEVDYDCRLGAGLQPLSQGECDSIVIAGMGGLMMCDMLIASEKIARSVRQMIFQPMNNAHVLRRFLSDHQFCIVNESIVREDERFYEVMVAENGEMPALTLEEAFAGVRAVRIEDEVFDCFLSDLIEKTTSVLRTVSKKSTENAKKRAEECRELIVALQKIRR